jgi:hypothetical protein
MEEELRRRSAEEVFEDHLRLAGEHRFEEDLQRNVSPDCVILERHGVFRGRDGARESAKLLEQELPSALVYAYTHQLVAGRVRSWSGPPRPKAAGCATARIRF